MDKKENFARTWQQILHLVQKSTSTQTNLQDGVHVARIAQVANADQPFDGI